MVRNFLVIDDNSRGVRYLGYDLVLTPSEYRILSRIAEAEKVSAEVIAIDCGFAQKKGNNISVHICAINRKAETIGKRKLILFEDGCYRINEFM